MVLKLKINQWILILIVHDVCWTESNIMLNVLFQCFVSMCCIIFQCVCHVFSLCSLMFNVFSLFFTVVFWICFLMFHCFHESSLFFYVIHYFHSLFNVYLGFSCFSVLHYFYCFFRCFCFCSLFVSFFFLFFINFHHFPLVFIIFHCVCSIVFHYL